MAAASLLPEYDRTFGFSVHLLLKGGLALDSGLAAQAAIALGRAWDSFDTFTVNAAFRADYRLPFPVKAPVNLKIGAAYFYDGLPGYGYHVHSAAPLLSVTGRYAGVSAGPVFHFYTIDGLERALAEINIAYSWYVNFYRSAAFVIGLKSYNFDDRACGTVGDMFVAVYGGVKVGGNLSVRAEAALRATGMWALAAAVYGFSFNAGVVYEW
jgi:hypothetical protein